MIRRRVVYRSATTTALDQLGLFNALKDHFELYHKCQKIRTAHLYIGSHEEQDKERLRHKIKKEHQHPVRLKWPFERLQDDLAEKKTEKEEKMKQMKRSFEASVDGKKVLKRKEERGWRNMRQKKELMKPKRDGRRERERERVMGKDWESSHVRVLTWVQMCVCVCGCVDLRVNVCVCLWPSLSA